MNISYKYKEINFWNGLSLYYKWLEDLFIIYDNENV